MCYVLVVDDNRDDAGYLKEEIESLGYKVRTSHTCDDALRIVDGQLRLCLLDVQLEAHDDGFTLARRIRETHEGVPIVFFSNIDTESAARRANNEFGADFYVKPLYHAKLKEILEGVFNC